MGAVRVMMLKAVIVFLLVMVLIGMIGKALFKKQKSLTCAHCGRYQIGAATCDCKKG